MKLERWIFIIFGALQIMIGVFLGITKLLGIHDVAIMHHFTIGCLMLYSAWLESELEKSKKGRETL